MRKITLHLIVTILLGFVFTFANAQKSNQRFENLDKSAIKTGILYDRAANFLDLSKFAGQENSETLKSKKWLTLYHEINRGIVSENKLKSFLKVKEEVTVDLRADVITIGILNYEINTFKSDVFEKGLVKVENKTYKSSQKNIYDTKKIFAVSPIKTKKYTGRNNKVRIKFSENYIFSNSSEIKNIKVDFADGRGYVFVEKNDILEINYNSEGKKIVKTRVTLENGNVLNSKFEITVRNRAMPIPSETWSNYTADIPYSGTAAEGEVGIIFGNGNTDFTRPVILVDGFDPGDTRDVSGVYDIANQENMMENFVTEGYDAVIVNFYGGDDYIQRNAMLVVKLVQEINARMTAAGTMKAANQIVIVGPSMGGLITRYAIRYMEQNGISHNVRNWISFDSPQKGANIPLGLQHWVRFFADEADIGGAIDAKAALSGPAAKQMLLYHYTATSGNTASPNGLHSSFYNELNAMGFPEQMRIVAIANGSGYSENQGFNATDKVVGYYYRNWKVDLDGDVWAMPNQTYSQIFEGLYNPIGWTNESQNVYVNNTLPYDGAPGGKRDTFLELDNTDTGGYGDIIALHDSHSFIPIISSMCVQNTVDPFYNINDNIATLTTPFDKLYYPHENQDHVKITPESYNWFYHEIYNYTPQFTTSPATTINEDANYTYTFNASDINEWNILEYTVIQKPTWLSYNAATKTLSGTPTNSNVGNYVVSIKVSDGLDASLQNFIITVANTNDAPIISSTAIETATEDTEYSYTFTASDEDPTPDILTLSATTIPAWLSFDASTGVLSGTPLNENVGVHNITLKVNDGTVDVEQIFTITVTNTNDAPIISSTAIETATEDTGYSYTFTASDEDPTPDILTLSATTIPAWLSFDASTGILSGTPLNENVGIHNVTLKVNDGTVDVEQIFTITVTNVNDAPELSINLEDQNIYIGEVFTYTFDENTFTDVDLDDELSYTATLSNGDALPTWLSFDSPTRTFSGTSTNANSFDIKVTASDNSNASVFDEFNLDIIETVGVNTISELGINIYPNPAQGNLTLSFDNEIPNKIEIIDINGRILKQISNENQKQINTDLSDLAKGIYMIKLYSENKISFKKLIIE